MSVHKTKFGSFRARWREGGRLISKSFKRKVDAEKFLAEVCLGIANPSLKATKSEMTLAQYSNEWLNTYATIHKTESSVLRDRQVLRLYILPKLGHLPITAIRRNDVMMFQAFLVRGSKLSAKTINNVLGLLGKMLADALANELIAVNPAKGVKAIKCPELDHHFWTFVERDRFLTFIRSRDRELYDVVAFALHTGLRRGEVEGLRRDCVDFERREIIVRRSFCHKTSKLNEYTKSKRIRRVPMNDVVYAVLQDRKLLLPNAKIFNLDFQHIVNRNFKPAQREAGVSIITFHDLRHSFASHLVMAGRNPFEVQKLLGHSDLKTTMRYMHLAPDHLKGITDVLMEQKVETVSTALAAGNQ